MTGGMRGSDMNAIEKTGGSTADIFKYGYREYKRRGGMGQLTESVSLAEALRDLAPTLKIVSRQYQKAAPLVDWLIDNYWLAIIGLGALVFGAAAIGAWYGSRKE